VEILDVVLVDLVKWGILGVGSIRTVAGPLSRPDWSEPAVATVGSDGHQANRTHDRQHTMDAIPSA
jgi:hypothetical protein